MGRSCPQTVATSEGSIPRLRWGNFSDKTSATNSEQNFCDVLVSTKRASKAHFRSYQVPSCIRAVLIMSSSHLRVPVFPSRKSDMSLASFMATPLPSRASIMNSRLPSHKNTPQWETLERVKSRISRENSAGEAVKNTSQVLIFSLISV